MLLAAVLIYPVALTLRGAFFSDAATRTGFTLINLRLVFEDPNLVAGLANALKVAAASTLLSVLLGLPLAVMSARYRYPLKGMFNALILVPMILPPFVGAVAMRLLLGREGSFNTLFGTAYDVLGEARFWGVVVVNALHLYPIIYLNAAAALANLDPALDEAATNLGAGPARRFFMITLPLIRPGLFAGSTLVFIFALTELGTPLAFDYTRMTPVQIYYGLKEVETSAQPYALTVVLLVLAVGLYAAGKWAFGGRGHAMYAKASRAAAERTLTGARAWAVTGLFGLVTLLAILPHLGVLLASVCVPGQWYRSVLPTAYTLDHFHAALTHTDAFNSIVISLKLSVAAVALDMVVGLVVGYMVVRTRVRGRGLLDALCMVPIAVPGLVMAFGYVAMSLRWPFGPGAPLEGVASVVGAAPAPLLLLVVSYSVRRLPYVVRSTTAGLEQTSGELEEAAMNLGASRFTAVRRVIVPLIAANLIASGLLVFSFSMLAVSESMLLAQQQRHFPITKAIFSFAGRLADGPYIAAAMGAWGMALLAVTLAGASVLMGQRLGQIFKV
ncbi:MAG: iron ABC transporter permease [Phycisphaerae bacterium]|nr:iron ABC transporter permease [Phycisphaerae bacterium]